MTKQNHTTCKKATNGTPLICHTHHTDARDIYDE